MNSGYPKQIKKADMKFYLNKIIKPSINLIKSVIPGKRTSGEWIKVVADCLLPWKEIYPDIVMVMTTRCSLKCKNCNNLMPHYADPYNVDLDELKSDIDRLSDRVDRVVKFSLIGGEPFVYPHFKEILKYALTKKNFMYISLTTNATIIPDSEMVKILKNPRIFVEISDYGVKTQKVNEFIDLCKREHIKYLPDKVVSWVSPGGTENRGKTKEQLMKEYDNCYSSRYCKTMLKGKIFLCSRGAHLYDLGYMDSTHDFFDTRKEMSRAEFRRGLRKFMTSNYADACNYCDHALNIKVKPGEQLN